MSGIGSLNIKSIYEKLGVDRGHIVCKCCGKEKDIDKLERVGDFYRCSCTAIIDSRGRVADYGKHDVFYIAQQIKLEDKEDKEEKPTKIKITCGVCHKETSMRYGNKWFTCQHCNTYQSLPITCECGSTFIATKNTWAYKCHHCQKVVDSEGVYLPARDYVVCGCCGEPYLRKWSSIGVGARDSIYKCPSCHTYSNGRGVQLFHEDLCTCKECMTLFEREKHRIKKDRQLPLGTLYKCPGCEGLLDYTGNSTQSGVQDRCNSCNMTFSRVHNANHPWLIRCPSCYEYVDKQGELLEKKDIIKCKKCGTLQPKYEMENGCVLCGYTEVKEGDYVCENCGSLYADEDLLGRACMLCGEKITKRC